MDFDALVRSTGAYFSWAPPWAFSLLLIAVALGAVLLVYGGIVSGLRKRLSSSEGAFWRPLLLRTRRPVRLALCIGAIGWAVEVAPLPARESSMVQHALLIAFIVLVGMAAMSAIDIGSALYMRRFRTDVPDNLHARKLLTQTRILRRSANVVVILLTAGIALMTIPGVKQVGVSLLAAGGAAGIIVGLALQPVLSNIFAGVQIAFTQPIRIDDQVSINGEFGNVEEIKATYVVVRLWDLRRLIVPLKFFLEQPFQNWTRENTTLLTGAIFYVDPRAPIQPIREKLEEIVRASPLWDGGLVKTQINDVRETALEIRCLVSARNSGDAGDLKAEIREKILEWMRDTHPDCLPHNRLEMLAQPAAEAPGKA
ncbi:MAG: mechanosensitive ion channel protein MscS [Phenylobacterium zucineum]|nr:MAG: mechanosensitive ion channel protein MscS [Phenylobacterium zucineum]